MAIISVPAIVLFFAAQRCFIRGMIMTGLKLWRSHRRSDAPIVKERALGIAVVSPEGASLAAVRTRDWY